jgi:hydrogenase expression/formation protein HypD
MKWLMEQGEATLSGFLLPGHVCTIAGIHEYEVFPVPQVIAGFEPLEVMYGLYMLVSRSRRAAPSSRTPTPGPSSPRATRRHCA